MEDVTDQDYRQSAEAHYLLAVSHDSNQDAAAALESSILATQHGEKIKDKSQADWYFLFMAYRSLSVRYFNQQPKNLEHFISIGNRMALISEKIEVMTSEILYGLIDTYHNWGCVTGGEGWLNYADDHRVLLLKKFWKDFKYYNDNKKEDEAKKCFVDICNVVDEIYNVKLLRQADPEIDLIIKEYLSFARNCEGKTELFEVVDKLQVVQGLFKTACEKKYWEQAENYLSQIAALVGIKVSSPYEAALFSDARINKLLLPTVELGFEFWTNDKRDEVLPLFENASKLILLLQHVTDDQWRSCGTGIYFCSKVHHDNNNDVGSLMACIRALRMLECIREKTQEDNNCIVLCKQTIDSFLKITKPLPLKPSASPKKSLNGKRMPKSAPPKPVVDSPHEKYQRLFDEACDEDDVEKATAYLKEIGQCWGVEVFSPSADVTLSDENIRDIVIRFNVLSMMYADNPQKLKSLLLLYRWWITLKEKSVKDWRLYISVQDEVSKIYFEQGRFQDAVVAINEVLKAHQNIKQVEKEHDIYVLIDACSYAAECCTAMMHEAEEREWYAKADQYRVALITWLKSEIHGLMNQCEAESKARAWDDMESTVYEAETVLAEIRKVVSNFVSPPSEDVMNYLDVQRYVLASTLYRVFEAFLKQPNVREAESVLGQIMVWLNKIPMLSDDAELLLIECRIYERAFGFMNDKKWKMQSALELARKTMPEEDKGKKEEIETRRKAVADAEKAEREQQRREVEGEKLRRKQEANAAKIKKEAEEKAIKDAQEKYEKEKTLVKGYVRKFKKLENTIDSREMEFFRERRRCLWNRATNVEKKKYLAGTRRDVARNAVVSACVVLVEACDTIMVCCGSVRGHSEKYFLNLSCAELVSLNEIFKRGAEFYEGGKQWNESQIHLTLFEKKTEWHKLEDALSARNAELGRLHCCSPRVRKPREVTVLYPVADAAPVLFFSNRVHLAQLRQPHRLVEECRKRLCRLFGLEVESNLKAKRNSFGVYLDKHGLGDICVALYKVCPTLVEVTEGHALYPLLKFLELCRDEPNDAELSVHPKELKKYFDRMCELLFLELDKRTTVRTAFERKNGLSREC